MIASAKPCDDDQLVMLLQERLSEIESEEVTRHLDRCAACRKRLQELAGEVQWWTETRDALSGNSTLSPISATACDTASPESHEGIEDELPWVRSFLEPPTEPKTLGRIGGYHVIRSVGQGGMGVVLRAKDSDLNRSVAIKVVHPHLAGIGAARKRFLREAQAAAAVMHPNVVPIYAVASENKLPFLVMPYIPGGNLQQRIDHEGALEIEDVLRIGIQVAEGLAAAHRHGLVHRDIKPANIMLEDGGHRVMISDFGLARALDDATMTASGLVAGTPQYMSPEQASGETVDHRSDLFSLGSLMYTLATGRPPYRGDSTLAVLKQVGQRKPKAVQEINERMPGWLDHVLAKLMATRPQDRPGSADDAAELLRTCLSHVREPAANRLPPALMRSRTLMRSLFTPVGSVIACGLLVAAYFAFLNETDVRVQEASAKQTSPETEMSARMSATEMSPESPQEAESLLSSPSQNTNTLTLLPSQSFDSPSVMEILDDGLGPAIRDVEESISKLENYE